VRGRAVCNLAGARPLERLHDLPGHHIFRTCFSSRIGWPGVEEPVSRQAHGEGGPCFGSRGNFDVAPVRSRVFARDVQTKPDSAGEIGPGFTFLIAFKLFESCSE
jgi:hypothetical protein